MAVYLQDIPLPEALERLKEALTNSGLWQILAVETLPLDENALGRVTSEPIWARISSPHYHAAAMDGFAVRAADTIGAEPARPIIIPVTLEKEQRSSETEQRARYMDTGDAMPSWADAVIPIENVESLDKYGRIASSVRKPTSIRIRAAVAPWSQVRLLGEDLVATQLVLPAGHVLRPVDLGAAAAAGHNQIRVARKPRVAILPTGSELVPLGTKLEAGRIPEFNSIILAAQINDMGGMARRYPIIKDDIDSISRVIEEAAGEHDLILLNAGSSAGEEDFSARAIAKLGRVLVHGVAVRPGHPVIIGMVIRKKPDKTNKVIEVPIIGVPGYPVSAALTIDIFVEPILAKWLGRRPIELQTEQAILTRKIVSPPGDDDYVRVAVGKVGNKLLAAPLARGAGVISSLVHADGLAILPRGIQGKEAGDSVTVRLYRTREEIEATIFCIGSHDMTIDIMAQFLTDRNRRLVSANVGSQGGLIALRRGEAHLAGSHLLDPQTGEYNLPYIKQYIPDIPVKVIALVGREQGLLVQRDNPRNIQSLSDLTKSGLRFINRQRGAGTRVLLDYELGVMGIPGDSIHGYHQEEYTHLGVAAAIASNRADCGLGIAAAAKALDLEFIPLFHERYDLIIPVLHAESELLQPLIELLSDDQFRIAVGKLPGYDVSIMGKHIWEG